MVLGIENHEASPDFAQLMLMMDDDPDDCFRGALLLIAKGESKDWRWYDAELFDDLDHMKRFVSESLRSEHGIQSYMMLLCSVKKSGLVDATDPESN